MTTQRLDAPSPVDRDREPVHGDGVAGGADGLDLVGGGTVHRRGVDDERAVAGADHRDVRRGGQRVEEGVRWRGRGDGRVGSWIVRSAAEHDDAGGDGHDRRRSGTDADPHAAAARCRGARGRGSGRDRLTADDGDARRAIVVLAAAQQARARARRRRAAMGSPAEAAPAMPARRVARQGSWSGRGRRGPGSRAASRRRPMRTAADRRDPWPCTPAAPARGRAGRPSVRAAAAARTGSAGPTCADQRWRTAPNRRRGGTAWRRARRCPNAATRRRPPGSPVRRTPPTARSGRCGCARRRRSRSRSRRAPVRRTPTGRCCAA